MVALKFVLKFIFLFDVEFFIVVLVAFSVLEPFLTESTARLTAWTLRLLGADGRAEGALVKSSLSYVEIIFECTASYSVMIFIAAVVAFPCSWKTKLYGILTGILVINTLRLVSLVYIGHWFPDLFDTIHLLAWQFLMIFAVMMLWLLWLSKMVRRHAR